MTPSTWSGACILKAHESLPGYLGFVRMEVGGQWPVPPADVGGDAKTAGFKAEELVYSFRWMPLDDSKFVRRVDLDFVATFEVSKEVLAGGKFGTSDVAARSSPDSRPKEPTQEPEFAPEPPELPGPKPDQLPGANKWLVLGKSLPGLGGLAGLTPGSGGKRKVVVGWRGETRAILTAEVVGSSSNSVQWFVGIPDFGWGPPKEIVPPKDPGKTWSFVHEGEEVLRVDYLGPGRVDASAQQEDHDGLPLLASKHELEVRNTSGLDLVCCFFCKCSGELQDFVLWSEGVEVNMPSLVTAPLADPKDWYPGPEELLGEIPAEEARLLLPWDSVEDVGSKVEIVIATSEKDRGPQ